MKQSMHLNLVIFTYFLQDLTIIIFINRLSRNLSGYNTNYQSKKSAARRDFCEDNLLLYEDNLLLYEKT